MVAVELAGLDAWRFERAPHPPRAPLSLQDQPESQYACSRVSGRKGKFCERERESAPLLYSDPVLTCRPLATLYCHVYEDRSKPPLILP